MSDDFEDLLKRWLRDRAGSDRSALQALAGNVAALPPRRRQPGRLVPLVASIAVVVGLLLVVAPRFGSVGNVASPTPSPTMRTPGIVLPGGPEAYANDPRLERCYGSQTDAEFVFEMPHARDYHRYFPKMGLSPEFDVDVPAFVVVLVADFPPPETVGMGQPKSNQPGRRYVCAIVGDGEPILYGDVDITGLTVANTPSETQVSVDATPDLVPVWAVNLLGQLQCDGPPQAIGGEIRTFEPIGARATISQ